MKEKSITDSPIDNLMTLFYPYGIITVFFALLSFQSAAGEEAFELVRIADGVYVHPGKIAMPDLNNHNEIANIGFIVGSQCVAVIDSGGNPEEGFALKKAIRALTPTPVCYVINTHVHGDHILGNLAFKSQGVHFVGHYRLPENMASRAQYELERAGRDWGIQLGPEHFALPDTLVQNERTIDLGDRQLEVRAWPTAHSATDVTVLDTKSSTLWLGDLLFMDHVPVIDGNLGGWLKTLSELEHIKAQRAIPGHGPSSAPWPQAMEEEVNYLGGLKKAVRHALDRNASIETAMETVGQDLHQHWRLFDQYHKRNVAATFAAMEWEDQ